MSNDLTNRLINETYGRVVQYVDSNFYDLLGNLITGSSIRSNYKIVSSSYNISTNDSNVEVIIEGVTQSLPTAVGNFGLELSIINASTGSIMILASGSELIGNDSSANSFLILFREDAPKLISNNIKWRFK